LTFDIEVGLPIRTAIQNEISAYDRRNLFANAASQLRAIHNEALTWRGAPAGKSASPLPTCDFFHGF
jgi:hypothetical protein